eukprot:1137843-Pelagomonas_calceolata.AAC.1
MCNETPAGTAWPVLSLFKKEKKQLRPEIVSLHQFRLRGHNNLKDVEVPSTSSQGRENASRLVVDL